MTSHGARQDVWLERVFRDLFPITDVNEKYKLEFLGYALGEANTRSRSASNGT